MKYLNLILALTLALLPLSNVYAQLAPSQLQQYATQYLANGGFENSSAGWKTYKDAAATTPADGTAGSPTSTFSVSTSSPLANKASGVMAHPASNVQGEGLSYAFTVDAAAKGKVISITGVYQIISGTYSGGTTSTDSDIELYIYDMDAATIIQPAGYKLDGGTSGVSYDINATFQSNASSTNYRLIFHYPNTTATAFSVKLDGLSVLKGDKRPASSDIVYTASVSSAGALSLLNVPSWLTSCTYGSPVANYWNCIPATGTFNAVPNCVANADGVGARIVNYNRGSTTTNLQFLEQLSNTGVNTSDTGFTVTCVKSGADSFKAGSSDSRIVALAVTGAVAGTTSASSAIKFPTISRDTHGGYNATTGQYTVPVAGDYIVSSFVSTNTTFALGNQLQVYVNGSLAKSLGICSQASYGASGTAIVSALAGQTIDIRSNGTVVDVSSISNFTLSRISGPTQIPASTTVSAAYQGTPATGLPNNSMTGLNSTYMTWAKVLDTHNGFTISSGAYTCPVSGIYRASLQINFSSSTTGNRQLQISQSGIFSQTYTGPVFTQGAGGSISGSVIEGIFRCNAGDTITPSAYQSSGGTLTLTNSQTFFVQMIGN